MPARQPLWLWPAPRARRVGQLHRIGLAAGLLAMLSGCVVAPRGGPYGGGRPQPRPAVQAPAPAPAPMGSTVYFYPERGQPEAQQERDRYACYRWAVRESGSDPGMTPLREVRAVALPPEPPHRRSDGSGPLVGAVAGAAVGAAVSSPRHAAENAVIGAIFGATLGAVAESQNDSRRAAAQRNDGRWTREAPDAGADPFRRAMSACMQGRGYRIG